VRELQGEQVEPEQELRIDLPVKAFVPPGWVAQESLRLELYRRISLAPDHERLAEIRAETIDRYGALPAHVEALFAIASLRITAARLGLREVSTFRDQVRLTPVPISATMQLDLADRIPGATFHGVRGTLNLAPERIFGAELVRWTEARLREAVGEPALPGIPAPSDDAPVH
jgi:transcription-repair coupling factor (superfamily II helicase)